MAISDFKIEGYRSIKELWLKLKPINVIVGPNGTGKSNLYRAMYLLSCAVKGQFARALAEEGGIDSALWAGHWEKRDERNCIVLSVRSGNYEYNLNCGMAGETSRGNFFAQDPEIKSETAFHLQKSAGELVKKKILDRHRMSITARNSQGKEVDYTTRVPPSESVLANLHDPMNFPALYAIREELMGWRFYHHFRTDIDSPLRLPQVGVLTQMLNHDGSDLAATLASIIKCGDAEALNSSIDEAFPGSNLWVEHSPAGLKIFFEQPGMKRPFEGTELSDGTLQYFCLLAALLSLEAPPVLVLNEPETSLHPGLIGPLANLLVRASNDSQIWITTHSRELADTIMDMTGYDPIELEKKEGRTKLVGRGLGGYKDDTDDIE